MTAKYITLNDGERVHRFCLYESDIEVGDETYQGTKAIGIGDLEVVMGTPDHRANFQLALIDDTDIEYFSTDPGIVDIEIGWLVSVDSVTWRKLSRTINGTLSGAEISEGIISTELETLKGDIAHEGYDVWSDETQQAEFKGDKGMGYVRLIAIGDVKIAWPR